MVESDKTVEIISGDRTPVPVRSRELEDRCAWSEPLRSNLAAAGPQRSPRPPLATRTQAIEVAERIDDRAFPASRSHQPTVPGPRSVRQTICERVRPL
jgi:hypothetical protein